MLSVYVTVITPSSLYCGQISAGGDFTTCSSFFNNTTSGATWASGITAPLGTGFVTPGPYPLIVQGSTCSRAPGSPPSCAPLHFDVLAEMVDLGKPPTP